MASKASYLFIASMDVDPEKEDLFNEIYDTEHIPLLLKVPGVISAKRYRNEPLTVFVRGEKQTVVVKDEPRYSAVYEIEGPEVLVSDAWAKAVDKGRWPTEVRPHVRNRRLVLRRLLEPES
jgi:hypothetical protein